MDEDQNPLNLSQDTTNPVDLVSWLPFGNPVHCDVSDLSEIVLGVTELEID